MKKTLLLLLIILFLSSVLAVSDHDDFSEGKALVESGVNRHQLTEEQLEEIGEYFMEQIYPGGSA